MTAMAEEALLSGDAGMLAAAVSNDLAPAALSLHPEIGEALSALRGENVLASSMTGSGSCVFALVSSAEEARSIAGKLQARGFSAYPVSSL